MRYVRKKIAYSGAETKLTLNYLEETHTLKKKVKYIIMFTVNSSYISFYCPILLFFIFFSTFNADLPTGIILTFGVSTVVEQLMFPKRCVRFCQHVASPIFLSFPASGDPVIGSSLATTGLWGLIQHRARSPQGNRAGKWVNKGHPPK